MEKKQRERKKERNEGKERRNEGEKIHLNRTKEI